MTHPASANGDSPLRGSAAPVAGARALGLTPGPALRGELELPASKSIAQRALLCAAWARGETRLVGHVEGEDVHAALDCIAALGATVHRGDGELRVRPGGLSPAVPGAPLPVGESGTLARLITAHVALGGVSLGTRVVTGHGSLMARRSAPLLASLRAAGARLTPQGEAGHWPLRIEPCALPGHLHLSDPVSSQELSALWMAAAAHAEQPVEVRVEGSVPSRPYLTITRRVLEAFGVEILPLEGAEGHAVTRLCGPLRAPLEPLQLEGDASNAAVLLVAACLSGGQVSVGHLPPDSPQGDRSVVEFLRAFGCHAGARGARLFAEGEPQRGADLDLQDHPDLAPVLAALAAGAAHRHGAHSTLRNLGTLRRKESDRLRGLERALGSLGYAARVAGDHLHIGPGPGAAGGPHRLDPHGDHRMAFAFALLGLVHPGVYVSDPDCVAKSWPSLWRALARLGAVAVEDAAQGSSEGPSGP